MVAVLVLASVTGLNTSLLTVVAALTLNAPTGITDSSRVVSLYPVVSFGEPELFSVAEYRFLADHAKSRRSSRSRSSVPIERCRLP